MRRGEKRKQKEGTKEVKSSERKKNATMTLKDIEEDREEERKSPVVVQTSLPIRMVQPVTHDDLGEEPKLNFLLECGTDQPRAFEYSDVSEGEELLEEIEAGSADVKVVECSEETERGVQVTPQTADKETRVVMGNFTRISRYEVREEGGGVTRTVEIREDWPYDIEGYLQRAHVIRQEAMGPYDPTEPNRFPV
ncbi:hypothetical protein SNE40_004844 [Patella caerulea]|uniref:Uncharacterized protein n=2 Tax=Patella caerulea TaxID=87958 RepID=A0AAN8PYM2_PATCE